MLRRCRHMAIQTNTMAKQKQDIRTYSTAPRPDLDDVEAPLVALPHSRAWHTNGQRQEGVRHGPV